MALPLWVISTLAAFSPSVVGVKVTSTVQLAPAASSAQGLAWPNDAASVPVRATPSAVTASALPLGTVTGCPVELVPAVWSPKASDGREVLRRLQALPGFGTQKAQVFLALLGKQCGVTPRGWRLAAGPYGEQGALRSIADVTSERTLLEVRAYKQSVEAAAGAGRP